MVLESTRILGCREMDRPEILFRGLRRFYKGILQDAPSEAPKGNMRGGLWSSESPVVASSYAPYNDSVVVPLRYLDDSPAVLDAKGLNWRQFFFDDRDFDSPRVRMAPSFNKLKNPEFEDALNDPAIRSILIRNIIDPGPGRHPVTSYGAKLASEGLGLPQEELIAQHEAILKPATNVFIKDPSSVGALFTDRPMRDFGKFAVPIAGLAAIGAAANSGDAEAGTHTNSHSAGMSPGLQEMLKSYNSDQSELPADASDTASLIAQLLPWLGGKLGGAATGIISGSSPALGELGRKQQQELGAPALPQELPPGYVLNPNYNLDGVFAVPDPRLSSPEALHYAMPAPVSRELADYVGLPQTGQAIEFVNSNQ